jgi:hypothetical protein
MFERIYEDAKSFLEPFQGIIYTILFFLLFYGFVWAVDKIPL